MFLTLTAKITVHTLQPCDSKSHKHKDRGCTQIYISEMYVLVIFFVIYD